MKQDLHSIPTVNDKYASNCFGFLSWSAILAGAFIGLGISFLFNLFNISIGLSLIASNPEGLERLAISGFLGMLIGTVVSTFVTGFIAGYLGPDGDEQGKSGVIYGFLAWCIALILMVTFTANMGTYVEAYSHGNTVAPPQTAQMNYSYSQSDEGSESGALSPKNVEMRKELGTGSFLIFTLFFVGALTSCFGGYSGTCCKKHKYGTQ